MPQYHHTQHAKPTAHGIQIAIVVGPAGEEIFTDEFGRIKVQFHWQRPVDHPEGNAALDDRSSTWVRVAATSADSTWGMQDIPRIGMEVLIAFQDNDIDRPICIGAVHNGQHTPPTFSGAGNLPANKTLSGTKTKEYKGGQFNELLFDDSAGELRTQLSSGHATTQLNQGFLIHPRTEGKGEPRGEGVELRTDAAGSLRALKGLLITTEVQYRAEGMQLARSKALQMLDAAITTADQLAEAAQHQHANQTETGKGNHTIDDDAQVGTPRHHGHQTHLKEALANWERGSNTDKENKSGQETQQGGQSIIAINAPDGIAMATSASTTIATGTNFDQVALRDTNQTTGRRWIHNIAHSMSLFVLGTAAKIKDTFTIKTAKGNIQLQAQDGEINITAQDGITFTSIDGTLIIQSPHEILFTAGGGYLKVGKNIELITPEMLSLKNAGVVMERKDSMSAQLPTLPKGSAIDPKNPSNKSDDFPFSE